MALRMSERITSNYTIPLLQSAITEALASAVAIRKEMRTKALQGCKSNIIRITLQGRSLLSPTLFHPDAIAQAEECARNAPPPPPVLHVNIDGGRLRAPTITTSKPHQGGGPRFPANRGRGSGPHVSRGWGQRSHRGSTSSLRGSHKPQTEKSSYHSSYGAEASKDYHDYTYDEQTSQRHTSRAAPFPRTATRQKELPEVTPHYLCVCAALSSIGPSRLPWPSGSSARVSPGNGSTNPQPCRGHHSQHAGEH